MKLSEAILAGIPHAPIHLRNGGYYRVGPEAVAADVLLTAYLGERDRLGMFLSMLGDDRKSVTTLCMHIQDVLLRQWPFLGARCSDAVAKAARASKSTPSPRRGMILAGYLCYLNDKTALTRKDIATLLQEAGL